MHCSGPPHASVWDAYMLGAFACRRDVRSMKPPGRDST